MKKIRRRWKTQRHETGWTRYLIWTRCIYHSWRHAIFFWFRFARGMEQNIYYNNAESHLKRTTCSRKHDSQRQLVSDAWSTSLASCCCYRPLRKKKTSSSLLASGLKFSVRVHRSLKTCTVDSVWKSGCRWKPTCCDHNDMMSVSVRRDDRGRFATNKSERRSWNYPVQCNAKWDFDVMTIAFAHLIS